MAAQIIPFPKLATMNEGMRQGPASVAPRDSLAAAGSTSKGLHLVQPTITNPLAFAAESQQTALRIVEAICIEHDLQHPALEPATARSLAFWATLPLPPARVETPLSVARRFARTILPVVELA